MLRSSRDCTSAFQFAAPASGCQYRAQIDRAGAAHQPAPVSLRLPIGQNPVTAKAQQPRAGCLQ